MPGGFQKDALGDMLGSLQTRVESLQRHSASGQILPCAMQLVTNGTPNANPPTVDAEYYRHTDFVQCWFITRMPTGFTVGTGAFILQTPWQMKGAPGAAGGGNLVGHWRAIDVSLNVTAVGEIYVIGGGDGRLYMWYVTTPPVGPYQFVSVSTPWAWAAGDLLQGEFRGHILPGF